MASLACMLAVGILFGLLSTGGAATLTIPGTGACEEVLRSVATVYERSHPLTKVVIPPSIHSEGGIREVIDGKAVLARVSRPLTPEEAGKGLIYRVFAQDAIVVAGRYPLVTEYALVHRKGTLPPEAGEFVDFLLRGEGRKSLPGHGMDEETKARMFEPFFTTKERGKGTGLGLASVYGIVKQSGGYIRAQSAPGRGTSFEVYLPVRGEDPDASEEKAAAPTNSPGTDGRGETILMVEDEEMVRKLMLEGLRRDGYSVLAAGNAQEAISLLERNSRPIDLLLTDLMMPGMNGMELAQRLMSSQPAMKVLLISGYTEEEVGKFVRTEAGAAFLQKPITPSVLSRKVREVLDSAG